MKFTNEQIDKAKSAKSAEELLTLAKEMGVELTVDETKKYFAEMHKEGELADDELDNVVGGGCGDPVEYETVSSWSPDGCNCNSYSPNSENAKYRCGGCIHFRPFENSYNGVCRREFK